MVSQYSCTKFKSLHGSLRIYRVQSVDSWKNALMDDNSGTASKRRRKILEDLNAILVRPIMEDGTEVVNICHDRLWCKEVATFIISMRLIIDCRSYCAMNMTLSFRSVESRESPSAIVSGRS
jgi:hypothetical protein